MLTLIRAFFLSLLFAVSAHAGVEPFSQEAFDKLKAQGQPILISIHAEWCPTCRAQAPVVDKLLREERFHGVHALRVDFDAQKDAVKAFKADRQSTLIVFKGGKEVGRSLGDTSEQGIAALLQKAL